MTDAGGRYARYLRHRYRIIAGYTGLICMIVGAIILLPLLLLTAYRQEAYLATAFALPGVALSAGGFVLWRWLVPQTNSGLTFQEGTVVVVLSWLAAMAVGATPFLLGAGLGWTQALFESTSGWTTTGLSVVDVTRAPRLFLFYRSAMQYAGGAGLAIITLSALVGPAGAGVSSAEGRGEQLAPHVRRSAKLVLAIYVGSLAAAVPLLRAAGMGWFDAANHAMAALSTGGFSTRLESIGYWDSPRVEAVIVLLMLMGMLNFLTSYALLRRQVRRAGRNTEVRLAAALIPLFSVILLFGVTLGLYPTLGKSVRVAVFETVTALSTTGFATVDYRPWNGLGWLILILLMMIGGGTGSTAGAIKQYRIYVMLQALVWEVRRALMPGRAVSRPYVWQGERKEYLTDERVRQVGVFVFLYVATYFAGSMVLAWHGYTLPESLFEFASALGTVGLSVGVTMPDAPLAVLWAEMAGMFLGRLEFFTILIGIAKIAADSRRLVR